MPQDAKADRQACHAMTRTLPCCPACCALLLLHALHPVGWHAITPSSGCCAQQSTLSLSCPQPTSLTCPCHTLPPPCSFGFHERVRFKKSAAAPEAPAAAAAAGEGQQEQGGEPMQADGAPKEQQEQQAAAAAAAEGAAAAAAAAAAAGPASHSKSRQLHVMGQEVRTCRWLPPALRLPCDGFWHRMLGGMQPAAHIRTPHGRFGVSFFTQEWNRFRDKVADYVNLLLQVGL